MPFPPGGDGPYASLLSSRNKFYAHFNGHFTEFDPPPTVLHSPAPTLPQMAMGMTEDDNGIIWSVTYPQARSLFDPVTRGFKDYGHVYKQNWNQYQRTVAADDAGLIYFGIGSTASQIIALDPKSGNATPMLWKPERIQGNAHVCRYTNGRVYGHAGIASENARYEFYKGTRVSSDAPDKLQKKAIITDSQGTFYREFPSGKG